jgi:hypothetical protein
LLSAAASSAIDGKTSGRHGLVPDRVTKKFVVHPNGTLFFTNIKKGNPYKVWQEYLANWKLIYRAEDEIVNLLTAAGFRTDSFKIEKDETGLTFLVTVNGPRSFCAP